MAGNEGMHDDCTQGTTLRNNCSDKINLNKAYYALHQRWKEKRNCQKKEKY